MADHNALPISTLPLGAHELRLKPDTADRDLHLFDALNLPNGSAGARLTATLAAGFEPVSDDADGGFGRLSMVERQAALFRLALDQGHWPAWFTTGCAHCGRLIDVSVRADEFECRPPRQSSPVIEVGSGSESRRFMLPNGTHEDILTLPDGARSVTVACALDAPLAAEEAGPWSEALDMAIERDAERQPTVLPVPCPYCGEQTEFWFDPYDWIARHASRSLHHVHLIAKQYAWSERDILDMPMARREAYLALIRGKA